MDTLNDWVERLQLVEHPEGGFYRETWRSSLELAASSIPHGAARAAGTSIHYLLPAGVRSRWHRVASDELWLFHHGDPLLLWIADQPTPAGAPTRLCIDAALQTVVPAHAWQSAESEVGAFGYSLVSCIVVPGFDFDDFEMES